jgi:subfamily B ATP-binding cassette protein MsbA
MVPLPVQEFAIGGRILGLAGNERRGAFLVGLLGLASAIFEGIGLSFLIPLATVATGGEASASIPVIGPIIEWLESWYTLDTIEVVALVVGFFFLGIIVGYLNLVISTILAMRFAHALRVRVFEPALDRPLSEIESLPSGKFVNNLATETWRVCDGLFLVIGVGVQAIACVVFVSFLFMLSPFYTGVLLIMTGIMATLVHVATRATKELGQMSLSANEAFMAHLWDTLGGLRVVRGFGQEAYERRRFMASSERVSAVSVRLGVLSGVVGPITQIMTVAMVATIVGIASLRGDSLATLVGFLAIAYRMQPRVSSILNARTQLRSIGASVEEIEACLAAPGKVSRAGRAFDGLRSGLVFENVSARYPHAEHPALRDINCSFAYGQVTAVAGYSGAGKSTLVALLLRFIEPGSGRILIDGVPLSDISPEHWHRRIAFVEQNSFLFNASVRENIGYGDLQADLSAIKEAARVAQADGFIGALPLGYDTLLGENGVRLSQGQRQRVALARSLLRKPDVLILDEATNALDRPTERALRAAIEDGRNARAIIVIAHRRETIENADHVIVLDRGKVVQVGTPATLSAAEGVYSQLYLD